MVWATTPPVLIPPGGSLQFTPAGGATIFGGSEAVDISGTVNQPVVYRQLASAQNGTFYVAYLMRLVAGAWAGTDTFSLHLADSGANTSTLNFGIRGGADFMVRNGTGAPASSDAFGGTLALEHHLLSGGAVEQAGGFDHLRPD